MAIFRKIQKHIFIFSKNTRRYNFRYAFLYLPHIDKFPLLNVLIKKCRDKVIMQYLCDEYAVIIKSFSNKQPNISLEAMMPVIWICWWDGEAAMPDIVKACYNSVKMNAKDYKIRLITRNNFHEFLTLPKYIIEKVNGGIISLTHLSDILRMALLYEHGGVYLDATIFVTGKIDLHTFSFFTIRNKYKTSNISKARWTGFCLAGSKHHIFFDFMMNFFYSYWKKSNHLLEYFLIDYAIALGYNSIPAIRDTLDAVPFNNFGLYILKQKLNHEYSDLLFEQCTVASQFHKLTWKTEFSKFTKDNKLSLYGYITKEL